MPIRLPSHALEASPPRGSGVLNDEPGELVRLAQALPGPGEDALEALARNLQDACGVDLVIVSQVVRQPMVSAQSLVWLDGGTLGKPRQWAVAGTPCEGVVEGRLCCVPSSVQAAFPEDAALAKLGAQAYLGLPLMGLEDVPVGLLTLVHRSPFDFTPGVVATVELLASRAALELERLRAAQKRTSMEDRLDLALRAAGMGAWHWDVIGDEVHWDEGLCELLGLTGERSTDLQGFLAKLPRCVRAQVGRLVASEGIGQEDEHSVELTVQVPDRGERAIRSTGRLFRDPQGHPERVAGVVWDVTRERDARRRLEQSERRYRGYFEHGLVGIAQISGDGQWIELNDELCRILGMTREDLLRATPGELLSPAERNRLVVQLQDEMHQGQASVFDEVTLTRPDGSTIVASTSIRVLRDARGRPQQYLALVVDMTERRTLESQLVQAQKLEAVGRLAGGVAHDFNNVLAVVLSSATLLQGKLPQPSLQHDLVGAIHDAAERGVRMTRQLLALARPQAEPTGVIDVARVVRGGVSMLRHLIGDDRTLELHADGSHGALIDEGQLEQVILNLVVNARDASAPGGRIEVSLDAAALSDGESGEVPGGRYVRLTVRDEGHGMSPAQLARVFEPFFTTKSAGQGTGLGLATCHAVVKHAGGAILVNSRQGKGTTFTVLLPEKPLPALTSGASDALDSVARESLSVLVVDDEPTLVTALEGLLVRAGHRVICAGGGTEALASLAEHPVDVVVSDVRMPGMSGVELGDEVRRRHPSVAFVLTSGQVRPEGATAEYFLEKPYQVAELDATLRAAVAARRL